MNKQDRLKRLHIAHSEFRELGCRELAEQTAEFIREETLTCPYCMNSDGIDEETKTCPRCKEPGHCEPEGAA